MNTNTQNNLTGFAVEVSNSCNPVEPITPEETAMSMPVENPPRTLKDISDTLGAILVQAETMSDVERSKLWQTLSLINASNHKPGKYSGTM